MSSSSSSDPVEDLLELGYLDLDALGHLPNPATLELLRLRLRKTVATIKSVHPLHTFRKAVNLRFEQFLDFRFHNKKVAVIAIKGTSPLELLDIIADVRLWSESVLVIT